jgi:RimJ/RimL family protein N-acetyltransferase
VTEIRLDQMSTKDFDAYFAMKSEAIDIEMSGFATAPNRGKLFSWIEIELANPTSVMLVAKSNESIDECVGYLFIRMLGEDRGEAEISYGVAAPHRGRRIGSKMLILATEYLRQEMPLLRTVVCWVAESNFASIQNIELAGYSDTGQVRETHFLSPKPHVRKMRKFALAI